MDNNLATAITSPAGGRTRTERAAFTAFRTYYLFGSHFCTPGAAHEKGQVEHGVGYVRRNALVPIPEVESYDALNAHLLAWCTGQDARTVHRQTETIGTRWAAERPHLRPLPPQPYVCCVTTQATLTPYSQIVFETNRYSVPADRAVRQLVVRAFPLTVEIGDGTTVLATHARSYARDQDILDPLHYLPLLAQRPGAFDHAKPIQRWQASWPPSYLRLLARLRQQWPDGRGVREFVAVLQLHATYPATVVAAAVDDALTRGCAHADGVRLCLQQALHPTVVTPPLAPDAHPLLAALAGQVIDLQAYDRLLTGGTP